MQTYPSRDRTNRCPSPCVVSPCTVDEAQPRPAPSVMHAPALSSDVASEPRRYIKTADIAVVGPGNTQSAFLIHQCKRYLTVHLHSIAYPPRTAHIASACTGTVILSTWACHGTYVDNASRRHGPPSTTTTTECQACGLRGWSHRHLVNISSRSHLNYISTTDRVAFTLSPRNSNHCGPLKLEENRQP